MTRNQTLTISLRILGMFIVIHHSVSLLNAAVINFNIIKNIQGTTTFLLGLASQTVMIILGAVLLMSAAKFRKKTASGIDDKLLSGTLTGLLLMASSFSAFLYLVSQSIRSYLSVRSLFHENPDLYSIVLHTFFVAGIELCFSIIEFFIGLAFLFDWFEKSKRWFMWYTNR